MDPNETLKRILSLAAERLDDDQDLSNDEVYSLSYDLADLISGLDGWLSKGGFLPERWEKK